MKVKVYGLLREITGSAEIEVAAVRDLDGLRTFLLANYPLLKEQSFEFAVNLKKVTENISLGENDEIALLPPFAGG